MPEEDRLVLKDDVTTAGLAGSLPGQAGERRGHQRGGQGRRRDPRRGHAATARCTAGAATSARSASTSIAPPAARGSASSWPGTSSSWPSTAASTSWSPTWSKARSAAKRTFEKLGFHKEAELPGHVKDIHGKKRDLLIYADDVSHIWSAMESAAGRFPARPGDAVAGPEPATAPGRVTATDRRVVVAAVGPARPAQAARARGIAGLRAAAMTFQLHTRCGERCHKTTRQGRPGRSSARHRSRLR